MHLSAHNGRNIYDSSGAQVEERRFRKVEFDMYSQWQSIFKKLCFQWVQDVMELICRPKKRNGQQEKLIFVICLEAHKTMEKQIFTQHKESCPLQTQ